MKKGTDPLKLRLLHRISRLPKPAQMVELQDYDWQKKHFPAKRF